MVTSCIETNTNFGVPEFTVVIKIVYLF